ncbi:MAG: response regulator transcription factor [Bacilli bacterium]|nr:response regulator transcription factor [Bacilli bacterium]
MSKILIVEDEKEIADLEKDYLEISGFQVDILNDGKDAIKHIAENNYDLLILDLMLPNTNGLEICKNVREKVDIPILTVTAKVGSIDKVRGLGIGADDYITKPFDPAELVARVEAHIKQYKRLTSNKNSKENVRIIKNIKIYMDCWKVYKNNEEIKFANKEFELPKFLAENANQVFSKEKLFETIWGYDYVGDVATVTVHINRIREKIEDDPSNPIIIETVWGAGYRLNQ